MIGLFILLVVVISVSIFITVGIIEKESKSSRYFDGTDKVVIIVIASLVAALTVFFFFTPAVKLTNGLAENYGMGQIEGYLVSARVEGVLFVTNEVGMQIGTGELSSLDTCFYLSTSSDQIMSMIQDNIGEKVRIYYREWLMQPYRRGNTDYDITDVTILKGNTE